MRPNWYQISIGNTSGDKSLKETVRIPAKIQRNAAALLDQQMWCWGCDVRRTQGNLLLAYGAEKRPAPNARYHSAYTFQLDNDAVLDLWGWGIWFTHKHWGSLFVSRSRCRMRYSSEFIPIPDAWQARDLPPMTGVRDDTEAGYAADLLATTLNWIGSYEGWLGSQVEPDYRERVLMAWPQRKRHKGGVPAEEVPARWFELAGQIVQNKIS
ncbi:hypothetical protein HC928_00690 [bacterium]|nr:hypothetical protein [bacterium]